jgi:hypothetical protein
LSKISSSDFYRDLVKISNDVDGIQKYINIGDEDLVKRDLNADYVQTMLYSYKPTLKFDTDKNELFNWTNLLNLPVMPLSLQYENVQNYIINKTKFTVRNTILYMFPFFRIQTKRFGSGFGRAQGSPSHNFLEIFFFGQFYREKSQIFFSRRPRRWGRLIHWTMTL